jgi:hypothetical protein
MENGKSYKWWHVLTSFVLGAAIVGGVFLVPSFTGQGRLIKGGANPFTSTACGTTNCDLENQIERLEGILDYKLDGMQTQLSQIVVRARDIELDMGSSFARQYNLITGDVVPYLERIESYVMN